MKSALIVLGLFSGLFLGQSFAHGQASQRQTGFVFEHVDPTTISPHVDTNVIFLNRCASGCAIKCNGGSDSRTNSSSVCPSGNRTLTSFKHGDAVWGQVVTCVRELFAPFGVSIVETDPGTAKHFEIMIAGRSTDIGLGSGTAGISPFSCSGPYIPNSLVFAFSDSYGSNEVNEICATAAQEIAHSFTLDHVIDSTDPLTYVDNNGLRRHFKNANLQCGSDCVQGQGPFGQTCNGPAIPGHFYAGPQNHACSCTGTAGQNSVATLNDLFGDGTPTPPTVTISRPKPGDIVVPGFPINSDVSDDIGVAKAELRIDGVLIKTLDSGPFAFNAPTTLGDGTHKVEVKGYDIFGSTAVAKVDVIIGAPCTKPADCSVETDTCVGGRCVAGTGVQGGLGTTCGGNEDCGSGLCANGESGQVCVEVCDPALAQCPGGFQCIETGSSGVCYPGTGDGGGCLSASSDSGPAPFGPLLLGLGLGAYVLVRRRRSW